MLSSSHVIANPSAQALSVIFRGIEVYHVLEEDANLAVDLVEDSTAVENLPSSFPETIAVTSSREHRDRYPMWMD
jgi:hypothetical protein